ncbi:MAG: ABC transporter permease, partial [Alphaproteobacteria bacterium]
MSARRGLGIVAIAVAAALALLCAAASLVEAALGIDHEATDLLARLEPPSLAHPLGTDDLGRDLLARLLHGGRVSLLVGVVAATIAAVLGTGLGLAAGYLGGRLDSILMRLTDLVIALPLLALLIVLAAVDLTRLGVPEDVAR